MKALHEVLVGPHMTEKTSEFLVQRTENTLMYVFKVGMTANKFEIKSAIERRFDVKVAEVNTVIVRGKIKRVRNQAGKKSNWKKAYVKLEPGMKIAEFEGV
jgi:large subunit ribosomal protein L23